MDAPSKPRWSVALSGGGHRASLYAAGTLLYLVDAGINTEVGSIVSVSGGSLTNGVLAQNPTPYSAMDRASYLAAIGPLLDRCTYKGTVQWAREVILWASATLLALAATITLLVLAGHEDHGWAWALGGVAALVVTVLLLSVRARVADRVFRRLLFTRDGKAVLLREGPDGCPTSPVLNIFCASELQSNLHLYFSPRFIFNHDLGLSTSYGDLPLSTAVQASSNFPPAFPARRFRLSRLGLPDHPDGATWTYLSDGGVYDNMGEQWVTGSFERVEQITPSAKQAQVEATAAMTLAQLSGDQPDHLIVVNSSKRDAFKRAAGWLRIPLLGEAGVVLRMTSLMHQVTTTTRRNRLVGDFDARRRLDDLKLAPSDAVTKLEHGIGIEGELIHIGTPARWVADRYPTFQHGGFGAINKAFAALTGDDAIWARHSFDVSSGVGTVLSALGEEKAAALLWQSYVLTMSYFCVDDETRPFTLPTKADMLEVLRAART